MHKVSLERLTHRVISDQTFRARLLVDPETAISEAGWDMPPDDLAALKAWHADNQQFTKLNELERSLAVFLASRAPHPP